MQAGRAAFRTNRGPPSGRKRQSIQLIPELARLLGVRPWLDWPTADWRRVGFDRAENSPYDEQVGFQSPAFCPGHG